MTAPTQSPSQSGIGAVPELAYSLVLVRKAQGGDARALNELFERYYDRVYRIVRIRMGAKLRNVLDSYDIVQETCIVAARKIHDFEPRDHASLIQWLATIAEHKIHDAVEYWEAEKRRKDKERALETTHGSSDDAPARLELAAPGKSPSSIVGGFELKEIYDACVESLPPDMRELILLREYADCDWPAVAAQLGKPNVHAAQEAYRRAQIKLGNCLRKRLRA